MERGRGARGHGRRCVEARVGVDAELPHRHYRINLPGRTDRGLRGMVVRWRSSERLGEWRTWRGHRSPYPRPREERPDMARLAASGGRLGGVASIFFGSTLLEKESFWVRDPFSGGDTN